MVLNGKTQVTLQSRSSASLQEGRVVVHADQDTDGFTLHMPLGDVIDLGTEFAVTVDRNGSSEVHAIDGKVECRTVHQVGAGKRLLAGQAVHSWVSSGKVRSIKLDALSFRDVVRRAVRQSRQDQAAVYEGFHYDEGVYAPESINTGRGWAGPWRVRSEDERQRPWTEDVSDDMRIVHEKLSEGWPVEGSTRGM